MADRLLRIPEVMQRTGKSRTTLWRDERNGTFPRRRLIGGNLIGWLESEVEAWVQSRPVAGDEPIRGRRRVAEPADAA